MAFDLFSLVGVGTNIGGITSTALVWLRYFALIPIGAIVVVLALWVKKQRGFSQPLFIVRDIGNGKIAITQTFCGKFRAEKKFFGLIEKGGEIELLSKLGNRKISDYSDEDLININGKLGYVVFQSPTDPEILIPISKSEIKDKHLILTAAPAEARDISVQIMERTIRDAQNPMWQMLNFAVPAIVIIGALVMIVVILQFAQHNLDQAATYSNQMMTLAADTAKQIKACTAAASTLVSHAP